MIKNKNKHQRDKKTMLNFLSELAKIAKRLGEDYFRVDCCYRKISVNSGIECYFTCYINGYDSIDGKTVDECLENMRIHSGLKKVFIEVMIVCTN